MRVLLTTLNAKYIHINLAIRLLYDLNKHHEGLEWKEFTIKENQNDVAISCSCFEIVAFSCYIWNITQTLEVAKKIKEINPACKVLLGGPEVSYEWEEIIALDFIDYIVIGEGEIPFSSFLQSFPNVEQVENLVYKKKGDINIKSNHHSTFDLKNYCDSNPYAFDAIETLPTKVLYIETSRGCPYKCEFCLASLDNKVRYLPTETIKAQLLYLMQHGRVIKFLDRTFNIKRDFTIEIFKFILAHHRPQNVFQFEITADILHPDIIKFIQENVPPNLFRFEIGIQTVNQKANLEVSRKQNFDKTKDIIISLSDKVEMHLDLIVGLALDYYEHIVYSFEEVFKLFAPELQLGFLKFLKGTPLRQKHEQHGFVFDPNPPYQIIESNYLSREQLHHLELLEQVLEIYWNKKRAVNTLKYVTTNYRIFEFMEKLGVYFSENTDFQKYTLSDVYAVLFDFAKLYYVDDIVLKELIAIDYYLYQKNRPKSQFINELDESKKNKTIVQNRLNHHKYRFAILPISFDFNQFSIDLSINKVPNDLIIQYDGLKKAEIVKLPLLIAE